MIYVSLNKKYVLFVQFLLYYIYKVREVETYYFRRNSQIFMYDTIFLTILEFNF